MFLLDNGGERRSCAKAGFVHLIVGIFCAVFGGIYEQFGHGVYSYWMIYAFLFPLLGGALPFLWLGLWGKRLPSRLARNLYHSGLACLTVGSIFCGVLEIYGTTHPLLQVYGWVGIPLSLAGIGRYLLPLKRKG